MTKKFSYLNLKTYAYSSQSYEDKSPTKIKNTYNWQQIEITQQAKTHPLYLQPLLIQDV